MERVVFVLKRKTAIVIASATIFASGSAVLSVWLFYTLFEIELRISEILAAAILPIVTTPYVIYFSLKQNEQIHELEKDIDVRNASLQAYQNSVRASNHILNNLMNVFQVVSMKSKKKQEIDRELIDKIEKNIDEASKQMQILNSIDNPLETESYKEIYPQ